MKYFMRQNLANKKSCNKGFALADLLVGAALTTSVIAVAGYGLTSMMGASSASNARTENRVEMNRSLDFIASEMRESTGVIKNVSDPKLSDGTTSLPIHSNFASSYSSLVDGGITKVLMVNINTTPTGTSRSPVIYFVAKPANGLWKGPRVLYRWGPKFNSSGGYDNPDTPSAWVSEAVVDNVADNTGATPSCTGGATMNGDPGFYSCVDSAGKNAKIFQKGKVNKLIGSTETYQVSMNTGSRQTIVTQPPVTIASGATAPIFNIVNGGVDVLQSSSVTVQTIAPPAGGGNGYPVATSIRVAVQPKGTVFTKAILQAGTFQGDARFATSKTYSVPAGNTISIAACSNNNNTSTNMNGLFQDYDVAPNEIQYCPISTNTNDQGNLSSYANYANSGGTGKTVFTLKNGDEIPSVKPASGQSSAAAFLSAYADPADANSTVKHLKLASNQVIYLFEFATLNKTNQYHDLQDTVVLVTFN
jgi:hypothetical protein